jgi:hypothetical protein
MEDRRSYTDFSQEEKKEVHSLITALLDSLMMEMPLITISQALCLVSVILSVAGRHIETVLEQRDDGVYLNLATIKSGEIAELFQKLATVMDNHLFGPEEQPSVPQAPPGTPIH